MPPRVPCPVYFAIPPAPTSTAISYGPTRVPEFSVIEQEARAADVLNHPNILTVHDIGSHEGTPYMGDGRSRRARLSTTRRRLRGASRRRTRSKSCIAISSPKICSSHGTGGSRFSNRTGIRSDIPGIKSRICFALASSVAERRVSVATAEGRGFVDWGAISRGAAKDSVVPTGLIAVLEPNHGLQPWLCSAAAPRLRYELV